MGQRASYAQPPDLCAERGALGSPLFLAASITFFATQATAEDKSVLVSQRLALVAIVARLVRGLGRPPENSWRDPMPSCCISNHSNRGSIMSWWDAFLRIRGGARQRIGRFDHEHEAIVEALKRLHYDCQVEVEGSDGGCYSYEDDPR